jgi:hypothetical protein
MKARGFMLAAVLFAVPFCRAAASADDMAPATDCATANETMMKMAAMPMPAMSSTDTMDKNFDMVMHMMVDHGMKMAKLEAKCGKDAKSRALAMKMEQDLEDYVTRTQALLLRQGG